VASEYNVADAANLDGGVGSSGGAGSASGSTELRRLTILLDEHGASPDEVIVHDAGGTTTRQELDDSIAAIRGALARAGLIGRRVGVCLPNRAIAIATWFAVWHVDGTVAPLNPRVPATELSKLIEAARIEVVITLPELLDHVPGVRAVAFETPLLGVVLDPAHWAHLRDAVEAPAATGRAPAISDPAFASASGADSGCPPALMQFTSGTTGRPKAVPLRHERILALLDPVIASLRKGDGSGRPPMPNLLPVSLSLWAGIYNVLFAFRVGAPVVLMERFETGEFARLVAKFGIKSSILPPAALVMLTDDTTLTTLAPLAYVRSVSAPLSPYQARRFHGRFGVAVLNGYGQTELGGEAVGWTAAEWREFGASKLGAVGRPHKGMHLRVRDDSGSTLGAEALGELEIRSDAGPPPESEGLKDRITDDGWLRTGDLARIDAEGFVWIEGRISAMINRGGLKVFPDEVEEILRSHPAVGEAAVVGVPDDRLGEVPVAFVVPAGDTDGSADVDSIDTDAIRTWAKEQMAGYKVPVAIVATHSLPRNEMGKLLRADLVVQWLER
jgi:long-chain acyl-CoA synthetase